MTLRLGDPVLSMESAPGVDGDRYGTAESLSSMDQSAAGKVAGVPRSFWDAATHRAAVLRLQGLPILSPRVGLRCTAVGARGCAADLTS